MLVNIHCNLPDMQNFIDSRLFKPTFEEYWKGAIELQLEASGTRRRGSDLKSVQRRIIRAENNGEPLLQRVLPSGKLPAIDYQACAMYILCYENTKYLGGLFYDKGLAPDNTKVMASMWNPLKYAESQHAPSRKRKSDETTGKENNDNSEDEKMPDAPLQTKDQNRVVTAHKRDFKFHEDLEKDSGG